MIYRAKLQARILTRFLVSTVRSKTIAANLMRQVTYKQLTCWKLVFCCSVRAGVPCACVHLVPWNPVEGHKCAAVSSFYRISTENFLSNFLKVSNVCLKNVNRFQKLIWFWSGRTLLACVYFNIVRLTILLTRLSGTLSNGLNAGNFHHFKQNQSILATFN